MRAHELYERIETTYLYHGTTVDRVRSILKHGLLPNGLTPYRYIKNKNKLNQLGISTDRKGNYETIEWQSLEGVYVTNSLDIAFKAARHAGEDNPVIVVVAVSMPSTLPDEDYIHANMYKAYIDTLHSMGLDKDEDVDDYGVKAYLEDFKPDVYKETWNEFKDRTIRRFHELSANGKNVDVSYDVLETAFLYWYETQFEGGIDDIGVPPEDVKDILVRKYDFKDPYNENLISRRITRPVTFKGRNRIVAIIDFSHGDPKVLWGKVPSSVQKDIQNYL